MKVEDSMGSLREFEMNLKQRKREKYITLKTVHEEEDYSDDYNNDELAQLTKNFRKFLKKVGKSSKFDFSFSITFIGKNSFRSSKFSNNKKRSQCKECERYGYIQSECATT